MSCARRENGVICDSLAGRRVTRDAVAPDYFDAPPDIAYRRFSRYANVVPGEQAYERWANRTDDAVTVALSISDALASR